MYKFVVSSICQINEAQTHQQKTNKEGGGRLASITKKCDAERGKHTRVAGKHVFKSELLAFNADADTVILEADSLTTDLSPLEITEAEEEEHDVELEESPGTTVLNFADVSKSESLQAGVPADVEEQKTDVIPIISGTDGAQGAAKVAEEKPPVLKVQFFVKVKKSGEVFEIKEETTSVGKSKYADIQIKDTKTVSRIHINFHKKDDTLFVEDNISTNGTFVNNEQLAGGAWREVFDGDVIRISDEVLLISKKVGGE